MENKKYFLHLEGMDLAGKSTISSLISERSQLNWVINNNKLTEDNQILEFTNNLGKAGAYDDEIYGYLYYVSLMADIKRFVLTENTIQDSTLLLRSINYHTFQKNYKLVRLFSELIELHPTPDKSIYLTADIDSRIKRLAQRIEKEPGKVSKNDSLILTSPDKFMRMDKELANLSQKYFNSTILDTSNMTEDEVVDYIFDECGFEPPVQKAFGMLEKGKQ